jgi:foldase protein PrsA
VRKHYDDNKAQYEVAESRKVRHILVKTKAQADKLVAQLKNGGDFAALAKKHSLDTGSKADGGTLTISRGQTVPEFDKKAFELELNEISAPVKTQFGFHIIQAQAKIVPGSTTPFEKVKADIKKQLLDQRKQEVVSKWTEATQKEYTVKVTYATGFAPPAEATADTAASKEK